MSEATDCFFVTDSNIEGELGEYLNPDSMVRDLMWWGELDEIEEDYGSNVYKLCRNAVAWTIKKLMPTQYIYDLKVVEGEFRGMDHCWMMVGDYYVDLTLAQFIKCPKFSVVPVEKGAELGYVPTRTFATPQGWIQHELDNY